MYLSAFQATASRAVVTGFAIATFLVDLRFFVFLVIIVAERNVVIITVITQTRMDNYLPVIIFPYLISGTERREFGAKPEPTRRLSALTRRLAFLCHSYLPFLSPV